MNIFTTDLFTSARGPGVIGLLLALVVLLGFGALAMLALDEGNSGGGNSLASQIRDAERIIASETASIEEGEKVLATIPGLKKISMDLLEAKAKNDFLSARISSRNEEIEELKTAAELLNGEFADYKNQYRAFVRNNAAGTKLDEINTLSGDVFKNVEVRKVTAVGIEIRHRDGHKRIGFEDLPEDMQDYYQFDKQQMLAEVQREAKVRRKHNAAVAVSDKAMEEKAAEQRIKGKEEARQKTLLEITAKEARLQTIQQEIGRLQSDLASSESAAASARAAGRMHLSKSNGIRGNINRKSSEYSRVQAEIASLRASL